MRGKLFMLAGKEKIAIVYNQYKTIEDICVIIESYKNKYKDFTFNVKLNKNSVSLEILYTPGYSKVDAYGIKGIIYKQNNVFLYKYTENKNLLDYFSVAIVAFFSIMFVYVWVTEGLRESTLFALIMLIALLIISSLFYMRKRILNRLYKFVEKEMQA